MSKIYILKTGLTDFIEGNLNFITDGLNMFRECYDIISFNSDLSSLTNGTNMFQGCSKLISFSGDLSSLTDGTSMFYSCHDIISFNSDLSSLTNGSNMFKSCTKLTSFSADLSSLTTGSSMFGNSSTLGTKLDLPSVLNIATTINDLAAQGKTGTITISMNKTIQGNTELDAALADIRSKGWTVSEIYKS